MSDNDDWIHVTAAGHPRVRWVAGDCVVEQPMREMTTEEIVARRV